jgi:hypothetical protein
MGYGVHWADFMRAFFALILNADPLVRTWTHRLSWSETPEGSPRIIAAELFVLDLAQIQRPDDRSVIDGHPGRHVIVEFRSVENLAA